MVAAGGQSVRLNFGLWTNQQSLHRGRPPTPPIRLHLSEEGLNLPNPAIGRDRPFRLGQMYFRFEHPAPGSGDDSFSDIFRQVENLDDLLIPRYLSGGGPKYVVLAMPI
jgi:hypothetical protein